MTATSSGSGSRSSFLTWWPVVALAGTAVLLGAVDFLPRWPGLIHAVALPPLDLSFDLRVLVARASSYPVFLIGAVGSLMVRSVFLAALLGAFPTEESFVDRLWRAARFYLIVWIPVVVAAGLSFAAMAALYHWYFWGAVGVLLATAMTTMPWPFRGELGRPMLLGYLSLLTLVGGLAEATGEWGPVALLPVSAAVTAVALHQRRQALRRSPAGVAGRFLAVPLVVAVGLSSAFDAIDASGPQINASEAVLLLVPGVDTSSGRGALYRLDPTALGFTCDRVFYYSYLGPGPGAPRRDARCPIRLHAPYRQEDTQLPLEQLSRRFARQIAAIRQTTQAAPVVVVTHSQGNLIAWRAISSETTPTVSHLVTLAGFVENRAPYPARGDEGPGLVGGDILRGLTGLVRRLGVGTFDPDAPLARRILATAGGTQTILSQRLPSGVQALTVEATFDAPLSPGGRSVPGARDGGTVDTTHVGVVTSARTAHVIRQFLAGEPEGRVTLLAVVLTWITPAFGSPPYDD